jgi:hypothetical protein
MRRWRLTHTFGATLAMAVDHLLAVVNLYKALGGGWEMPVGGG